MPIHQPIGDPDPEPPQPDGTYTRMYRDGRRFYYSTCRWCGALVDRSRGAAFCPECDNPEHDPTTKETP